MRRAVPRRILYAFAVISIAVIALVVAMAGGGAGAGAKPAAPTAGAVYWGAYISGETYAHGGRSGWSDAPWDRRSWRRFERNAGRSVSLLHFGQPAPWQQRFDPVPLRLTRERGAIPLVDMDTADPDLHGRRPTLQQVAAGDRDRQLRGWARAAARYGSPFFLRLNWEMNGSWFRWGEEAAADPAAFVAAWRRFHHIADAQGASNVTWVWCPNVVFDESTPLRQLYPGDEYVDWTCMDGYNHGDHPTHPSGWISFAELFGPTYSQLLELAPRKPMMIAETGSTEIRGGVRDPAAKAAWIRSALRTDLPRRFPRIKAVNWFNWSILAGGAEHRWDWPIESSAAARRAFAQAIAAPYYAGNRFHRLARDRKVRPLP